MALKGDISDLDRFQYGGMPVIPQRDSYSVKSRGGVVQSDIAGGLSRQYVQFMNSPYTVNVTYMGLDGGAIFFLEEFLDRHRGEKFIATLLVGGVENDEFVVQTVGDWSVKKTGFNGSLSLTLQVEPAIDRCYNDWAYETFQCISAQEFCNMNDWLAIGMVNSMDEYSYYDQAIIEISALNDKLIQEEKRLENLL